MVVYWITNTVNNKVYVGQTNKTLKQRWSMHTTTSECPLLHRAIKKHGKENFKIEVLQECESREEMNFVEIFYIEFLNSKAPNGYNLTDGGGGRQGFIVSDETREKLSIANKGKLPQARLLDQSGPKNHMFGKTTSDKQKEAARKASLGNQHGLGRKNHTQPHSEETKTVLSTKTKALWDNPEYRKHMSEVHKGKGHKHTEETKALLREKHNPISDKNLNHKGKEVYVRIKDGAWT